MGSTLVMNLEEASGLFLRIDYANGKKILSLLKSKLL